MDGSLAEDQLGIRVPDPRMLEDNPENSRLSAGVLAAEPRVLFEFAMLAFTNCGLLFPQMELFLDALMPEFGAVLPQMSALPFPLAAPPKNDVLRSGFVDGMAVSRYLLSPTTSPSVVDARYCESISTLPARDAAIPLLMSGFLESGSAEKDPFECIANGEPDNFELGKFQPAELPIAPMLPNEPALPGSALTPAAA